MQAIFLPSRSLGIPRRRGRGGQGLSAPACLVRVLQGGLDEYVCRPGGDIRLLAGCESAQVLQDDQCLPSDDHRQSGYQAFEPGVVEPLRGRVRDFRGYGNPGALGAPAPMLLG